MFYYYKISQEGEVVGFATSLSLRVYNPFDKKMYCCDEKRAQYISVDEEIYRTNWFQPEDVHMEGTFPAVDLDIISKDEYEKGISN